MPRGDRTGPWGMGAMSGRAAGFCAGFGMPGYMNPTPGRGVGMGYGRGRGGRGGRHRFYATSLPRWQRYGGGPFAYPTINVDDEKQALQNEAEALQRELEAIQKRLDEIETKAAAE